MNAPIIQLLILAGIAIFLVLRLRSVLGTREGFESQPTPAPAERKNRFEVIDGGPDHDVIDHVDENSDAAKALLDMKRTDPSFSVAEFMQGARGAYEMILMAFENGDLSEVQPFLSEDVYEAFAGVVESRKEQGLTIEANFVGIAELAIQDATFDDTSKEGEISMRFVGELTSVVRDNGGDIVEGDATSIKRQRDIWTFARTMDANDPNWQLVATSE